MPKKVYEYERIKTSVDNQRILKEQGYTPVYSSNVSAIQRQLKDLYIRFHNGSVYVYPGSGDMFNDLLTSSSKGKWVWANLRRPNKPYNKVGSMPLEGDRDFTDVELEQELERLGLLVQAIAKLEALGVTYKPFGKVVGTYEHKVIQGVEVQETPTQQEIAQINDVYNFVEDVDTPYFMKNEAWFKVVEDKITLTEHATPEAIKSYKDYLKLIEGKT